MLAGEFTVIVADAPYERSSSLPAPPQAASMAARLIGAHRRHGANAAALSASLLHIMVVTLPVVGPDPVDLRLRSTTLSTLRAGCVAVFPAGRTVLPALAADCTFQAAGPGRCQIACIACLATRPTADWMEPRPRAVCRAHDLLGSGPSNQDRSSAGMSCHEPSSDPLACLLPGMFARGFDRAWLKVSVIQAVQANDYGADLRLDFLGQTCLRTNLMIKRVLASMRPRRPVVEIVSDNLSVGRDHSIHAAGAWTATTWPRCIWTTAGRFSCARRPAPEPAADCSLEETRDDGGLEPATP
jgi:hypothetical protein